MKLSGLVRKQYKHPKSFHKNGDIMFGSDGWDGNALKR